MKKTTQHRMQCLTTYILTSFIAFSLSLPKCSLAQVSLATPSITENGVKLCPNCTPGAGGILSVDAINCDAHELSATTTGNPSQELQVIIWGDLTTNIITPPYKIPYQTGFSLMDNTSSTSVEQSLPTGGGLSGAHKPDVVIGNYIASSQHYVVAAVYESGGQIYLETFEVSGWGSAVALTPNANNPIQISSNGSNDAREPHIDLGADHGTWTIGSRSDMRNFAIVWHEWDGSSQYKVMGAYGDLNNPTSFTTQTIANNGMHADVAVSVADAGGGSLRDSAYVTYTNNLNKSVFLTEWDITNNVIGPSYTLESGLNHAYPPRIEAKIGFDLAGSQSQAVCQVVASIDMPCGCSSQIWIGSYQLTHNTPTNTITTNYYSISNPENNLSPSICGTGPTNPNYVTNLGADAFSTLWYNQANNNGSGSNGDMYSLSTDFTGATANGPAEVNAIALTSGFSTSVLPVTAITNCSNSGYDLMPVWYGGNDIWYKNLDQTFSFKPSAITNINAVKQYSVYPNPASDKLSVSGTNSAMYSITDAMGRTVNTGAISSTQNSISVTGLQNGIYMLNISENGSFHKMKFVKL